MLIQNSLLFATLSVIELDWQIYSTIFPLIDSIIKLFAFDASAQLDDIPVGAYTYDIIFGSIFLESKEPHFSTNMMQKGAMNESR